MIHCQECGYIGNEYEFKNGCPECGNWDSWTLKPVVYTPQEGEVK